MNLGIDYFARKDQADPTLPELVITEINARWTGGLFPAELVRRLGCENEPVVAFIDMCPPALFEAYMDFVEANIPDAQSTPFSIAPMGFAPFEMEMDGRTFIFIWQIVIGDFEAFKTEKDRVFEDDPMPTANLIHTAS